jgi:hypothetical protein
MNSLPLLPYLLQFLLFMLAHYFNSLEKTINHAKVDENENRKIPFSNTIKWIIPLHFFFILGIISLKAFTFITFKEMNIFLLLIEVVLGGYIGYIITAVFNLEKS